MALYSSPQAQDFATGANQDVNLARSNVKGPNGSVTWLPPTTPGGQWTQSTTLNPNEQATLTGTQGSNATMAGGAATMTPWAVGAESGPMDYNQFMPGGTHVQGGQYYDQKAGDAVYQQFADRMEPQFKQQTAAMDVQLRNQGLKPGDEAYDTQMKQVAQEQGDQRQRASQDAVQMAGQEGQRMQGMDVSAGNYNTDQRNAQITQELQKRGYGVDEIKKMLDGINVAIPTGQNGPIGNTYSDAMARTYGEDANASKDKNASTGSWLNLAGKVGSKVLDKYGGTILDKAGSWLGFSPAAATASPTVAGSAVAAGDASALGAADGSAFAAAPQFTMAGAVPSAAAPAAVAPAAASAAAPTAATAAPAASGSWLGAVGAAAPAAAITYMGLTTAPYRASAKWWSGLGTSLTSGKSGNATYDANTPPDQQIYNSKQSLYRMLQNQGSAKAIAGGANGMQVPQGILDQAKKFGMLNADGSVNTKWNAGPDPLVAAQRQKTGYTMYNGHWVPSGGVAVGSGSGKVA